MIDWIITSCVKNRLFVVIVTVVIVAIGIYSMQKTPVDAIPDLSDVQVIVYTDFPGQAPQVVEEQVTYPLTTAMLAVPYATNVRGYSFFGFSMVYIIFEDGTDLYWARSRVLEYLNFARDRLPSGTSPQLGPDATGVGWIYEYTLTDFSPRSAVLRDKLDKNKSGVVETVELPSPKDESKIRGEKIAVYGESQLEELFTTDTPPGAAGPEQFVRESQHYIVEAFDRDRDKRISAAELEAAANFQGHDLALLRSKQDWYLRYELMSVPGVSEVASVGGFVKQYQVEVDPEKLRAYSLSLAQVKKAIKRSNVDVGGRLIEMAETEFMVRSKGYLRSLDDLATIPVGMDQDEHTPIFLSQIADIHLGPELRRGIVEMNGEGEVVTGIVLVRFGENALAVIDRVKARLEELKAGLPPGIEIHTSYDRSNLINKAIDTLSTKLIEEMIVVALICIVFLLHFRSAFVAIFTLPVGILMAFIFMRVFDISADIMSLSGIAIAVGVMVDASVVLVENLHKHKEHSPDAKHIDLVILASKEVGPALFFSLLIVTVSFLPVFSLEQQEGRLFSPLAYTKTFAMASAALLAITIIPVLMFYFVRGNIRPEAKNPISRLFIFLYKPVIRAVLRFPIPTVILAVAIAAVSWFPFASLGSQFMPPLNEGDLLYMPTTQPGISTTKAAELLQQTDKLIAKHPQVKHVLGKIGRAETATDPAPLTMIETTIILTEKDTWPSGKSIEDIIRELDAMVQFPGVTNAWTMPIKTRIDMLATGIKTPVGIKLMGEDLEVLSEFGQEIESVLQTLPDTRSVYSERVVGGNFVDIDVNRRAAARFGLNVADVQDIIMSAIGGMNITSTVEGLERYPVNVRYPRDLRNDLDKLRRVAVPTPMGHTVPLGSIATIEIAKGPPMIKSENSKPTAWIFVDLNTSDVGGYVKKAKKLVATMALPEGVTIAWSGQFEYMERANKKLWTLGLLVLAVIFLLLFLHFRNVTESLIVMVTLPFALVGSVWLLWFAGYDWSVAVSVGCIALAGLAAETGVVMLVYLDETYERWKREGRLKSLGDLKSIIIEGAVGRVRPKIMTVATTTIGLLPIMFGTETGTRVMKRIAAPMVGGLISSTILTLVIIPAIYLLWKGAVHHREFALAETRLVNNGSGQPQPIPSRGELADEFPTDNQDDQENK